MSEPRVLTAEELDIFEYRARRGVSMQIPQADDMLCLILAHRELQRRARALALELAPCEECNRFATWKVPFYEHTDYYCDEHVDGKTGEEPSWKPQPIKAARALAELLPQEGEGEHD